MCIWKNQEKKRNSKNALTEYKRPKKKNKIEVDPNLFRKQRLNNSIETTLMNKRNGHVLETKLLLDSGNTCMYSAMSQKFYNKLKNYGFLERAYLSKTDSNITGANSEKFGVKKIMKKRLRFYTKKN